MTGPDTTRRLFLGAATAALVPAAARAQGPTGSWAPSRPIRVIVPFAAGGVADLTVRTVGQRMAERVGQPVVVDNRPSAGGIVAAQQLMGAAPDGHTLLTTTNGTAISRGLFRTLPYDPLRDLSHIAILGTFPIAVVVAPNGARDIGTLLARLRAEPGKLNIGTIAAGSTQNLSAELFKIRTGTRFETITFPATPQLTTALLRGDVDAAFEISGPIKGQLESGAIRAVAVSSSARATTLPEVPTLREAGVPDYDVSSWNALSLRAGTPPEAVAFLNRAVNEVLAEPGTRETLTRSGVEVRGGPPEALRDLLAQDTARWAEVIEKAGIERQ